MRHLIIGAGNMGQRHGKILCRLGDSVEYVDMGFEPKKKSFKGIDSVLICTPAETHEKYLRFFNHTGIPVFCEKPVFHKRYWINYLGPSMVSCNWRFCRCIRSLEDMDTSVLHVRYPSGCAYRALDLIHFLDLFSDKFGVPAHGIAKRFLGGAELILSNSRHLMHAEIVFSDVDRLSLFNGTAIHSKPCDMFERQMRHWRNFVSGRNTENLNSINEAIGRTTHLLELLKNETHLH